MNEQKTTQIRASVKQINAYYAIQMRIARKQLAPKMLQFGQLPIAEASTILGELMKQNPGPTNTVRELKAKVVQAGGGTPSKAA